MSMMMMMMMTHRSLTVTAFLFSTFSFLPPPKKKHSTFRKLFNTRSQQTVYVCLEMFNCLQAERTIAIRKRKLLNKFCVIRNALCRVFVAIAKIRQNLNHVARTFS